MMLYQSLFVATLIALTSVLPSSSRPRTKRISRGPVWTDFRSLALDKDSIDAAKQQLGRRQRIAVIARPSESDMADVAAEVIRPGLRYSDRLIVVDPATSESIFPGVGTDQQICDIAAANHIDLVLVVEVDKQAKRMQYRVCIASVGGSNNYPGGALPDTNSAIAGFVRARKLLIRQMRMLPDDHVEQLDRQPKASFAAMKHSIAARRILASVVQVEDADQRSEICQRAMGEIDKALADSPNYLEAYLLKASCQDELGQTVQLEQTLKVAFGKKDPPEHDALTLLELKGDHARFVTKKSDRAYETYQDLLEIDPTNLTGLWTMIDLSLTPEPGVEPDPEGAAEFAATLVACHPQSSVAKAILEQPPAE